MAGQVIMQGFLRRGIPVWVRRLVTMLPSLVVIVLGLDPTRTLVISQVVLSFGLPFAVVPLVLFTRRGDLMGVLVNRRATTCVAALVARPDRGAEPVPDLRRIVYGVRPCFRICSFRWTVRGWRNPRWRLPRTWRRSCARASR